METLELNKLPSFGKHFCTIHTHTHTRPTMTTHAFLAHFALYFTEKNYCVTETHLIMIHFMYFVYML